MTDEKRKTGPARRRRDDASGESKGQYGGLKGLGPGGGRDIADATKTEDIDPDELREETGR
jgi:hypothetical protein